MGLKSAWSELWIDSNNQGNKLNFEIDSHTSSSLSSLDNRNIFTNQTNLNFYREFGFLKNIVNAVADDATREWIHIKIKNIDDEKKSNEISKAMIERGKDFNLQNKTRNLIKYSRIFSEGAAFFFGIDGGPGGTAETIDKTLAIPTTIKKIEFINLIDDPDLFNIIVQNISDPTIRNFGIPFFQISGMNVHPSRVAWLVNEFNSQEETGVSVVETVIDGIRAQTAGLQGSTHILERLGAVIFKSAENSLSDNAASVIREILLKIKADLKSSGVMGTLPADEIKMLSHQFSGVKEVFDFVIDNLVGLSGVPRMIILGARGGGIVTGDGSETELISYFMKVRSFQKNTLDFILRKPFDLFLIETGTKLSKLIKGQKIEYDIEYNPLFELTDKAKADIRKTNSESDEKDLLTGKTTGDELRTLDDRYSDLAPLPKDDDEEENTGDAAIEREIETEDTSQNN